MVRVTGSGGGPAYIHQQATTWETVAVINRPHMPLFNSTVLEIVGGSSAGW